MKNIKPLSNSGFFAFIKYLYKNIVYERKREEITTNYK